MALTPDGKRAVSASSDRTLKIWELDSGNLLRTLRGHEDWVLAVALAPDGKRAVSASDDRTLKIWELDSGRLLRTLEGHESGIQGVALTSDGKQAVSASDDRTLRIWELEMGRLLAFTVLDSSLRSVAIAPPPEDKTDDGPIIIAGGAVGNLYCLRYVEPKAGGR